MNLQGLGAFLIGATIFGAGTFAIGFATGYVAGHQGPIFNMELTNSTVSFCAPSGGYYNQSEAGKCPETTQDKSYLSEDDSIFYQGYP